MKNSVFHTFDGANRATAEASLEFGHFRVLLRQRLLLADGVPIELGTRAFELLLALLEANGLLVSKEQLLARVWSGIAVAEDNLKAQVFALRRALGEDRDFIRTEFGRGYRFTAAVHSTVGRSPCRRSTRPYWSTRELFPQRSVRRPSQAGRSKITAETRPSDEFPAAIRSCGYTRFHVYAETTGSGDIG